MSAEAAPIHLGGVESADALRVVRVVRYAAGSTLAVALAMGIDWQLSYLAPILALSFLAPPARRPDAKMMVGVVALVAVAALFGVVLSAALLSYPVVFLLVVGLLLFLLFYFNARGAPPMVITLLMIAVTVIPILGLQSIFLAVAVAKGLVMGAAAAIGVVWVAHTLMPDPAIASRSEETTSGRPAPPALSQAQCVARAWTSTIVVFPVVTLYLYAGMTSVLVLVFIAILSMQPDVNAGFKAGKALVVGNLMGGIAAIVMFELLVMVPEFFYLLLLTLLAALAFGSRLFSNAPTAPLFGMAFSTILIVVLSATTAFGEADAKAWTRVLQITAAVVYLVLAHAAVQSFRGKAETLHATD